MKVVMIILVQGYYDNRIANWGSVDPLLEKHIQYSPYNYVVRNPILFFDPDGMQVSREMQKADDGAILTIGPSIAIDPKVVGQALEEVIKLVGTGVVIGYGVNIFIHPSTSEQAVKETVGETEDVTIRELYTQHGKTNVKHGEYINTSTESLVQRKKELSGRRLDKNERKERQKIKEELKGRKLIPNRQTKDIPKEDINN